MDTFKAKTMIYMLIISAVGTLVGLAVMKLSGTGQPTSAPQQKALQLSGLENSSSITSPQAKKFIENQKESQEATREVEKSPF